MPRRVTPEGIALIKKYEGYSNSAYKCPAGKWTISYGLTGQDIRQGTIWTDEQCQRRFDARLAQFEADVERLLLGARVSDGCFSALVSLAWNIGIDAFAKSTCLRKLRAGDHTGAWSELPRWVHSNGVLLPGLVKRRAAEQALWDVWATRRA